ncbi:Nramp family divalent metal transporter [bacterium]|nr:Nramp family divalent metal transporter [bacterium]
MKSLRRFPPSKSLSWSDIGASLVAIGLGIGSGEFILWPYLSVKHGYGILWAAALGIAFQVFLNNEIQRYSIVTGHSAVKGFIKISKYFTVWLLFSTLLGFGWPGFASGSALLLGKAFAVSPSVQQFLPFVLLIGAILVLTLVKDSYHRIEKIFKYLFPLSFVFIFFLFLHYFDVTQFQSLLSGILGKGDGYRFIPSGLDLAVFLGAFAYAGSGGNLLLGQGYYIIKKRHGMAQYGETETSAAEDLKSLHYFRGTRKFIILENIIVFGGMGLLTILMLSYLGPVLLGTNTTYNGFDFLIAQSEVIGHDVGSWVATGFLLSGAIALFSVQLGVFDILGRIAADILGKPEILWYRVVIVVQGMFGMGIFLLGIREPLWLITIGAVCNALAMAVISGVILWLNNTRLPQSYRPSSLEKSLLFGICVTYTAFFLYTIITTAQKYLVP